MAESAGGPADSYIGSLISLTSKSEIRYEGLLYTVDTENSNIALQNVRSFGTEGRKKNGPQIPASDKVYEFIIFRGTDIKDLQVKMSPPPSIHNDPAIISVQDQPSQPVSAPSAYVPLVADLTGNANSTSYTASAVPYYHSANSGVTLWAPPPPPLGPSGNMPVNWQGFYRPPDERQPLNHLPLPPPAAAALAAAGTVPTPEPAPAQVPSAHLGPEQPSSQPLIASIFAHSPPSHIPLRKELDRLGGTSTISVVDPARPMFSAHPTFLGLKTPLPVSNSLSSSSSAPNADSCDPIHETSSAGVQPSKSLVKQFDEVKVQPHLEVRSVGSSGVSSGIGLPLVAPATQAVRKVSSASRKGPVTHKQVYKQVQGARDPPKSGHRLAVLKSQPPSAQPLLPLPVCPIQHKAVIQVHDWVFNSNPMRRGRGRGSGMGRAGRGVHSRSKLLEDFDFIAMNEKFKKEEVWDELLKVEAKERVGEGGDATRGFMDGGVEKEADKAFDRSLSEISRRSVYVKDDFFDSLSCDALDQEHGRSERRKFSEQRKVDTETFGSFHLKYHRGRHGAYGGRGLGRGVGRGRGQGQGRGNSFRYYSSSRGEGRAGPVG